MEIKIYQINRNRDKNFVKFLHYKHLDNFQETKDINAAIYDEVFRGDADCEDLEDVYRMTNRENTSIQRKRSKRSASESTVCESARKANISTDTPTLPTPTFSYSA